MRTHVGGHKALSSTEFEEHTTDIETFTAYLAELFLGRCGETEEQRAAREAAAHDVLADLQAEASYDDNAQDIAAYATALSKVTPLHSRRRAALREAAA